MSKHSFLLLLLLHRAGQGIILVKLISVESGCDCWWPPQIKATVNWKGEASGFYMSSIMCDRFTDN